jgi:hypothetical protein
MGREYSMNEIQRHTCRVFVGKPEGKSPLERPRRRWEDNIKMELKTNRMAWCALDSSDSDYGLVEGFCEHGNEPLGSLKCWKIVA